MKNQEITTKEDPVAARTLHNSWIPNSYTFAFSALAQTAAAAEIETNTQTTEKRRLKSWVPWPVF